MNLTFMALNLPKAVIYIVKDAYQAVGAFDVEEAELEILWNLAFNIATFYFVIYFPLNLYFNRIFRNELREWMCQVSRNQVAYPSISTRKTSTIK
jgi:hypothetical protein